jgi:predicted dehydrogenase
MHILIIGCGSVGKRHAMNLFNSGIRKISFIDPQIKRCEDFSKEINLQSFFKTIEESYILADISGVIIASPTYFHINDCKKVLRFKCPILIEKPISMNLYDALELKKINLDGIPILLGYTWRWWKPLNVLKEKMNSDIIGKTRHVQFYMGAHLEDWHPWENYRDFFMSKKELGGGALLDESHWIDLMIWLFGVPDKLISEYSKISDLEITSDDNVDCICFYPDKRVLLHLDIFSRPHEKYIKIVGEKGTIYWSPEPNYIQISTFENGAINSFKEEFNYERNSMFKSIIEHFISIIGNNAQPYCTIDDGIAVMNLIEKIREKSDNIHSENKINYVWE